MQSLREISQDKQLRWVFLAALVAVLVFVFATMVSGGAGFPLDDGWIHQTYARNLARTGRWEYVPGITSAGSTAPLWTLWLALGYLLRVPHLFWAYLSGALSLVWMCLVAVRLWQTLWPDQRERGWIVGILMAGTWPLVWAAASGMETVLFIALGLQAILTYLRVGQSKWGAAYVGLWSGCMILVRPDGLPLLLLLTVALFSGQPELKRKQQFRNAVICLLGAGLPLIPYFLFNRWASGQWWPNTFYAKQSEYQSLLVVPLWERFGRLLYFSLGGPDTGWRGISGGSSVIAAWPDWSRSGGSAGGSGPKAFFLYNASALGRGPCVALCLAFARYLPAWTLPDGGAAGLDIVRHCWLASYHCDCSQAFWRALEPEPVNDLRSNAACFLPFRSSGIYD